MLVFLYMLAMFIIGIALLGRSFLAMLLHGVFIEDIYCMMELMVFKMCWIEV